MDEYIPFIYTNRVDGNLFINLSDEDWVDMGIKNRYGRDGVAFYYLFSIHSRP